MAIKSLLLEELENSLQMKNGYEKELKKLPKGALVKKKINGQEYYYIIFREKGKVRFIYKGKKLAKEMIKKYAQAKGYRVKYKKMLSQVKKQIKYLRRVLSGKEAI
ncbi:MAG: hypothetical protein PHX21_09810 [bacterium]|nr:hypothetical protein [bacterium]